jgi:ubiquinone/menaquinone biosynthesis C-methylase UbiE
MRHAPVSDGLPPPVAARVYDRIGRLQDTQAPIERRAVERLIAVGRLREAHAVFELGCGTGALARRLLSDVLPADATYVGGDVSSRMVQLARRRVAPWSQRAEVIELDGTLPLPRPDRSANRFVAAYVFDLLEPAYTRQVLDEAHRILDESGLLCVSSLTWGRSPSSRAVSKAWMALWRRAPRLVGGCRPIRFSDLLDPTRWQVEENEVLESWGVPSEVVVAARVL